jgi:tRNA(adenine34) deaminase
MKPDNKSLTVKKHQQTTDGETAQCSVQQRGGVSGKRLLQVGDGEQKKAAQQPRKVKDASCMEAGIKAQSEIDIKFMHEALKEAHLAAAEDEVPIGAVVVCWGRIIGRGHNMTERLNDPTAHAEMIAITAACGEMGGKYLNDCILYVTVEPCPMCAAAMNWAQLGKLVYGAGDPKRGFTLYKPSLLHPKTETVSGVMAEDCSALVSDYFKTKR